MAILRFPALIDPHLHMIDTDHQSWHYLAQVAYRSGYAALQVMPDIDPPVIDKLTLANCEEISRSSIIPFYLVIAATPTNYRQLKQIHNISAVKVWLGTGPEDLVVSKEEDLRQILLSTDKVVMIHAEDETTLLRNYDLSDRRLDLAEHEQIFDRTAALRACVKAITAAKETGRRVYLCHISTAEEVEIIRTAKNRGIRLYAEVAPHHLFLTRDDLDRLGILGKVNPPLRTSEDQKALWEGITDGTIDTIGSDTHTWLLKEKQVKYDQSPSGVPNLELTLPLLLTSVKEKKLSLERAIELTSTNPARIFSIPRPTRSLFVDMDNPHRLKPQLTDWHPYDADQFIGLPVRITPNRK